MHRAGFDHAAGHGGGQCRHQQRVVHATAAGDHPLRVRLRRAQGVGNGAHAEREQGRLHVGGRFVAAQFRFHPGEVELVAAGGFRWRQREPGLVQQAREQRLVDASLRREAAARVVGLAAVAQAPGVHQSIRRAGIEAAQGEGDFPVRAMAQGLAVRTDRGDVRRRHAARLDRRFCGLRERAADAHVEFADLVQGEHGRALAEFDQARAQRGIPRVGAAEGEFGARVRGVAIETHQRSVDAVGAGAGDQAEVVLVARGIRHAVQYRIACRQAGAAISRACCAWARPWRWPRGCPRRACRSRPRLRGSSRARDGSRS